MQRLRRTTHEKCPPFLSFFKTAIFPPYESQTTNNFGIGYTIYFSRARYNCFQNKDFCTFAIFLNKLTRLELSNRRVPLSDHRNQSNLSHVKMQAFIS